MIFFKINCNDIRNWFILFLLSSFLLFGNVVLYSGHFVNLTVTNKETAVAFDQSNTSNLNTDEKKEGG